MLSRVPPESLLSAGLAAAGVDRDRLAEAVFVKFLHHTLSFLLSVLYSVEGSYHVQPTLKG